MTTLKEHLLMWPALAVLATMMGLLFYGISSSMGPGQMMINCSIAEISPDYTPEMRAECRKLRAK
jgi:hypothetical protein